MTDADLMAVTQPLGDTASPRFQNRAGVEAIVGKGKMFTPSSPQTLTGGKIAAAADATCILTVLATFNAPAFAKEENRLLWLTSLPVDGRNDLAAAPRSRRRNFEVKIDQAHEVGATSKSESTKLSTLQKL